MISVKPNRPVINWGNPITKGIVFDVPLFENSGLGARDIVHNTRGTFGNSPLWVTKQMGTGVGFTGSDADKIEYITQSRVNDIHKVTVETMAIMDASPGNGIRIMHKGGTSRRYFQNLEHDNGNMYCAADWSGSQGAWSFSAALITTGLPFHHIVTYDDSSTTNDPVVYLNGKTIALTEVVTPAGARNTDAATLNIGNSFGTTHSWKGTIFYVRMWDRCITATEARSLYTNPWQIYGQPRFRSYDVAAAPPGGSTYVGSYYGPGGYF